MRIHAVDQGAQDCIRSRDTWMVGSPKFGSDGSGIVMFSGFGATRLARHAFLERE